MPILLLFALLSVSGARVVAQEQPDAESYRKYALTHEGDVSRGMKLFNEEQRLGCARCHSVDGRASKAGPDLFAAGDAFGRRDLVEAILNPSATIAPGYGTVMVETKSGTVVMGTLKQKTDAVIQLMGADGQLVSIGSADIKEQSGSPVSLMPAGLYVMLTREEFTDLIEYLTTLREAPSTLISNRGMPREITSVAKSVKVERFLSSDFTLPRSKAETGLSSFRQVRGSDNTFLVLHQKGMIWKVTKSGGGEEKHVFLDLTQEVFSERGPNGLLDVTFHPQFRDNGRYYLFYQVLENGKVATRIVEREFNAARDADSGQAGRLIWRVESVAEDHSGGCLQFGPDGFLYITMGDTGPHNDPNGHAQNLQLLLGKLLRIDVDHPQNGRAYSIPLDNPFREETGIPPEIWAYGFRNPWRFCFDRATGRLWLADVGQDRAEEVDIVRRGENYGWNVFEGYAPFSNQFRKKDRTYVMPVFAYRRKYGNSITGGHVYRGDGKSSFFGVYICGDYNSKRLFGLTEENGALRVVRQIGVVPQRIASFTEDELGNIYVVGYEGTVYRIDFADARFE